ncbi:unnamed protein product, partial [Closterium sp. Naga37s-1]
KFRSRSSSIASRCAVPFASASRIRALRYSVTGLRARDLQQQGRSLHSPGEIQQAKGANTTAPPRHPRHGGNGTAAAGNRTKGGHSNKGHHQGNITAAGGPKRGNGTAARGPRRGNGTAAGGPRRGNGTAAGGPRRGNGTAAGGPKRGNNTAAGGPSPKLANGNVKNGNVPNKNGSGGGGANKLRRPKQIAEETSLPSHPCYCLFTNLFPTLCTISSIPFVSPPLPLSSFLFLPFRASSPLSPSPLLSSHLPHSSPSVLSLLLFPFSPNLPFPSSHLLPLPSSPPFLTLSPPLPPSPLTPVSLSSPPDVLSSSPAANHLFTNSSNPFPSLLNAFSLFCLP